MAESLKNLRAEFQRNFSVFRPPWLPIAFAVVAFASAGSGIAVFIPSRYSAPILWLALLTLMTATGRAAVSLVYVHKVVKELHLQCQKCGKHLSSHQPWKCGVCGKDNAGPLHTFLNACEYCTKEPLGFFCPHCGDSFFLDDSGGRAVWAKVAGSELKAAPKIDPRQEEVDRIQYEIKLNTLLTDRAKAIANRRAAEAKAEPKSPPVLRSIREQIRENLDQERDREMALTEIVAEALSEIRRMYANDPHKLARWEEFMEDFRERQIKNLRL